MNTGAQEHEAVILDAARDLMVEGGMKALSMRAVAGRVGVTATTLYHYFENKQDLVSRVVWRAFERFDAYLENAAHAHPRGSFERVRAMGEAYIDFALENEAYFRVIFSIQLRNPPVVAELPAGGGYPRLREAVAEAMAGGSIREADPDLVSHYLWGLVHGVVTLVLAGRLPGREGCFADRGEVSARELFAAFVPLVRFGLEEPGRLTG